jgi:hypothetical protein
MHLCPNFDRYGMLNYLEFVWNPQCAAGCCWRHRTTSRVLFARNKHTGNCKCFVQDEVVWPCAWRGSVSVKGCILQISVYRNGHEPFRSHVVPSVCPCDHSAVRLTFQSLAVTLRNTRFNIKKFYVVPTLRSCVLYGSQNKQQLLPYKILRDWFL